MRSDQIRAGGSHAAYADIVIKGSVVITLLEVRQFMHHDRVQKFRLHTLEHNRDVNFALALKFGALHSRDTGVHTQRVLDDM